MTDLEAPDSSRCLTVLPGFMVLSARMTVMVLAKTGNSHTLKARVAHVHTHCPLLATGEPASQRHSQKLQRTAHALLPECGLLQGPPLLPSNNGEATRDHTGSMANRRTWVWILTAPPISASDAIVLASEMSLRARVLPRHHAGDEDTMPRFLQCAVDLQEGADSAQRLHLQQAELPQGVIYLKTMQGVVTSICSDYALINESIYFSCDVVTGNIPLKVGQKVTAVLEKGEASHEFKAIRVDVLVEDIDDSRPANIETRVITARVTSVIANIVCIDEEIYFSLDIVSEDFMPYNGDWVEVEYSTLPCPCNIKVHSAKPLFCKRLEEVCITSLQGRNGVIDNSIFFTMDSHKLPDGYSPQKYDIVDIVVVGSIQSCYVWRAISMSPVSNLS
ncbi:cancer/testis antigen 55-like [Tupaia chinensis]|uniref:cancer/testis antigen 55-like n=1 Tax=Tupaia chinensis TaxID=246437 RepID=UPI0003C8F087|nr:cancer/testis antigen 55-like [Tupaia chinensis]